MASIIAEIARRTGVSKSTVTRVLNGGVSYNRPFYAERAARIRALAEELNYRPNLAARAIRTGRFRTLCLLATDSGRGGLPPSLIDGITHGATAHEHLLTQARLPDAGFLDRQQLPSILRAAMADGLLINYTHAWPEGLDRAIGQTGLPAIWLNCQRSANCIYFADYEACRDATEHLIAKGHRRIALFNPGYRADDPLLHYSSEDRWRGYAVAMRSAGLKPLHLTAGAGKPGDLLQQVPQLATVLRAEDHPTAIICSTNGAAMVAASLRCGRRVPDDIAICLFARYQMEGQGLPVATLELQQLALGTHAVAMLMRLLAEPDRPLQPSCLPVPLHGEKFLPPHPPT